MFDWEAVFSTHFFIKHMMTLPVIVKQGKKEVMTKSHSVGKCKQTFLQGINRSEAEDPTGKEFPPPPPPPPERPANEKYCNYLFLSPRILAPPLFLISQLMYDMLFCYNITIRLYDSPQVFTQWLWPAEVNNLLIIMQRQAVMIHTFYFFIHNHTDAAALHSGSSWIH